MRVGVENRKHILHRFILITAIKIIFFYLFMPIRSGQNVVMIVIKYAIIISPI